jgi:hypothetical protein
LSALRKSITGIDAKSTSNRCAIDVQFAAIDIHPHEMSVQRWRGAKRSLRDSANLHRQATSPQRQQTASAGASDDSKIVKPITAHCKT